MSHDTIMVTFDRYNEDQKIETFQKSFMNEQAMYDWTRSQMGHPFLSDRIAKIESIILDTSPGV